MTSNLVGVTSEISEPYIGIQRIFFLSMSVRTYGLGHITVMACWFECLFSDISEDIKLRSYSSTARKALIELISVSLFGWPYTVF